MAQMLKADDLRRRDRLKEAEFVSATLISSLKEQRALTEELDPATIAFEFPFGVLINTLLAHADIIESLGRGDEAERYRAEGLELARGLGSAELAERQRQLAGSLQEKGRFNEALAHLVAARDLFVRLNDSLSAARCAVDLAQAYEWLRDFDRALEQAAAAWLLLKQHGIAPDHPVLAAAAVEGMVRQFGGLSLSDFASPEEMNAPLASAQRLQSQVRVQGILCDLYQVEARCLITRRRFDEARRLFEKARPMLLGYALPALDYQFAKIEAEAGRFDAALTKIEEILPLAASGALRRKLGGLLRLKAAALEGLGRTLDALQTAVQAREALAGFDDPDLEWQAAALEARIRAKLDDPAGALRAYDDAIEILDFLRRAPLGPRLDNLNLSNKLPVYREAAGLAAKQGDAARACRYVELIKSRQLSASLSLPGGSGPPSELSRQFDAVTEQIAALEYGAGDAATGDLVQRRNELLERLRIDDPRWRTLTSPAPFELGQILAFLRRRDHAALSFLLDGDRILAVLLNQDGAQAGTKQLTTAAREAIASYQANLGSRQPVAERFDPASIPGLDLAALIPDSLIESVLEAKTLLLSPHRELHLLPWSMLELNGRRLCQFMPSAVIPNLSCAPLLELPASPPRAAFIGVSAPDQSSISAEEECAALAKLHEKRGSLAHAPFVDAAATRKQFLELIRNESASLLHTSCHGEFTPGEPMLASLLLADAKVDAAGLTRERIAPREIILSACSVGQRGLVDGRIELLGDEMLGLIGALMEGGACSIIASIPPAGDIPTLEFMKLYHQARSAGTPPLQAMQSTQQTMLEDGIFPAWKWGGITLFGVS